MVPEQNLLTGIFAVQLKFVTPQELVLAGAQWALHQDQDICAILLEHGAITTSQADLLRQLTEQQIQSHGGDASAALQTFGGGSAVEESFAGSIIFERETGVRYRSVGRVAPQTGEGVEHSLPDPSRLITEYPDRYTTRGEQGRGAVGRVLIVYDEHIGREIALKELLPDAAAARMREADSPRRQSTTLTARFLREARITGQLEHPGIVPVYELGQREDGTTYYTMKLVRGETLADRLRDCRNIGDRLKLLPHYLDLCQAIAYAHSRGVIHRDIKPGNVMIGEFGETVLLDWGLAKVKGQKDEGAQKLADEIKLLKEAAATETVAGSPIGTPSYMSPEQADGRIEEIDERSDVWCLGAVLYEILTGNAPFTGVTAYEVIGKVLSDEVKPVLELQQDAPAELAAVAMNCLKKDRAKRYRAVEEIADDVTAFQTGGMVSAYTYSAGLILRRWVKQHWAGVSAAIGLFVVIAGALAVVAGQNRVIQAQNETVTESNNELVRQKSTLLVRSLNASAGSMLHQQIGMLFALQARNFELRQSGTISGSTANALREQLADYSLGSRRLTGHAGAVRDVAFSLDGSLLASAGADGTVRVWQVDDFGAEPQVLTGHEGYVFWLFFSPDGRHLGSAGQDGTIHLWRVDDLSAEPQVFSGHETEVRHFTFSPDGRLLASAGFGEKVLMWQVDDIAAGPRELRGHDGKVLRLHFSPDGHLLVANCLDGTIRVWQVDDLTAKPQVLTGHESGVLWIAFSPDGRLMASTGADGTVRIWKVSDLAARPQVLKGHESAVLWVSFSPDGSLLATTSRDETVRVWQVADLSAEPEVLRGHEWPLDHVFFSPDGKLLTSAGDDAIHVWQVSDLAAEPQVLSGHEGPALAIRSSPVGSLLASAGEDGAVRVWQIDSLTTEPRVLKGGTDHMRQVSFSPDGSQLACIGGGEANVWRLGIPAGELRVWQADDLAGEPLVLQEGLVKAYDVSFSSDGRLLASVGDDGIVRVWQANDLAADPQVLKGHSSVSQDLSFSPDGSLLASTGDDGIVRVWQIASLSAEPQQLDGHEYRVNYLSFSPDGSLLASAQIYDAVRVWRVGDLSAEQQLLSGSSGFIRDLSFSPDGTLLVSAGLDESVNVWQVDNLTGELRVWRVADLAAEPQVLEVAKADFLALAFSPDGSLLVTAGGDGLVRVWHAADLAVEPQVLWGHEGDVRQVAFSPDGRLLASAGFDKTIRVWQVDNLTAEPQKLKGHDGVIFDLSFSPDGSLLASAANDGTVRVWKVDINAVTDLLEGECYRNLSWDEWQMYVGKFVPYEKTIPRLPPGSGVPLDGAIAAQL